VDSTARIIAAHADNKTTAIVTDGDHGIVRVMISGKEVARFTVDGLQVRDAIEYGGTITDTGTAYFDHRAGGSGAP
jgi:hypothetical protein